MQRYPNEKGKLKPCLRTIINYYGKILFRNEIEFDLEKILSCLVNTRVNIMHIKLIKESLHWMVENQFYMLLNELFVSACDFRKVENKCFFI